MMGIPMPIKAGKARCRQRFIDRRPHVDPGVTRRDLAGKACQLFGEERIEQICVARAAAMMDEACNHADPQLTQAGHARIRPAPIARVWRIWGNHIPDNRVTQRLHAKPSQKVEVRQPVGMAGFNNLVAVNIPHTNHTAFNAGPKL